MALNHQGASEAPKGEAQAKYVGGKGHPQGNCLFTLVLGEC